MLRDELLRELTTIGSADAAAAWAHKRLPAKNKLTDEDARLVEDAFARRLAPFETEVESTRSTAAVSQAEQIVGPAMPSPAVRSLALAPGGPHIPAREMPPEPTGIDKRSLPIGNPRRYRDKAHLRFVAKESCLICGRRPCDPHHVRFAPESRARLQGQR